MSQENVEVVAQAYEVLRCSGVDAFSEYWADDIEWQTTRSQWFGPNAGRVYLQELVDLFDGFTTEPLELFDAGDNRVVIYLRYGGRSKRGSVEIPPEYFAIVIQVRHGKIAHAVEYGTKQEALEAVGLSE
jgi:ketosteroid isomerase-like protein